MLLLQLEMLAYVDESIQTPGLVIGAGIPRGWANETLEVRGVQTSLGAVDWSYRDGKVRARIHGHRRCAVRLGNGFPTGSRLEAIFDD